MRNHCIETVVEYKKQKLCICLFFLHISTRTKVKSASSGGYQRWHPSIHNGGYNRVVKQATLCLPIREQSCANNIGYVMYICPCTKTCTTLSQTRDYLAGVPHRITPGCLELLVCFSYISYICPCPPFWSIGRFHPPVLIFAV